MRLNPALKTKAVELRKRGFSYSEILHSVPVARSTLSLWLAPLSKSLGLPSWEMLRRAQTSGTNKKRKIRIDRTNKIKQFAIKEISKIGRKELLLLGAMLYWGEGAKQSGRNVSQQVSFGNSDPLMCKLFIKWIKECFRVTEDMIVPSIYIHISRKNRVNEALEYWSKETGIPKDNFKKTCFSNTKLSEHRRRKDKEKYFGLLRIRIRKSTDLNRRINGLIEGVCMQCNLTKG